MNGVMEDRKGGAGYRSYMDRIVVDESLHKRIMSRIAQSSRAQGAGLAVRRLLNVGRLGLVLACAAAIALAIRVIPQLVNPPQIAVPPIALVFNRVEGGASPVEGDMSPSKRYIPGYFTQELSEDEVGALFGDAWPRLDEDYRVSAEAGFSGEGEILQVTVRCERRLTGRVVSIVMANGAVPMDVRYPDGATSTDVSGVPVTAGVWEIPSDRRPMLHYATFVMGETGYYIEVAGDEEARDEVTAFVAMIIGSGAADLSRVTADYIPEWREDDVTLAEAQGDPAFGAFVPDGSPEGFAFESGRRVLNQRQDYLRITWSSGLKYVTWTVRRMDPSNSVRIVDVAAPETYDLSLYPIPHAQSVPVELKEIVNNPIIRVEDLTIDFIRARSYTVDDAGDDPTGYRMQFSVLYGDVLVEINAKGVTPEDVWAMFEYPKSTAPLSNATLYGNSSAVMMPSATVGSASMRLRASSSDSWQACPHCGLSPARIP